MVRLASGATRKLLAWFSYFVTSSLAQDLALQMRDSQRSKMKKMLCSGPVFSSSVCSVPWQFLPSPSFVSYLLQGCGDGFVAFLRLELSCGVLSCYFS